MSPSPDGVTELLHRASDGLAPDIDRLVSAGITRGRTRQRRARIGTTVASLAVIGVIGAAAAVVPQVGGADSARDPGIATEPTSTPPVPTATADPTDPPAPSVPVTLAVPAAEVPATVEQVLSLQGRISRPSIHLDERDEKFVQLLVDGMVTDVGMQVDARGTRARCEEDATSLGGTCEDVENGGWLLTWGPSLADGVTCTGVDLQRYGFDVWATSCNAADSKDSTPLSPAPPLDAAQLRALVSTGVWFE